MLQGMGPCLEPQVMTESDSKSIDDYLATFYQSASLDSQGRFTLDLEGRARKTAFQVVQPELFLLPLMMAAWLGGARHFEIGSSGSGFAMLFDGQICAEHELNELLDNLENRIPDSLEPRLRIYRQLCGLLNNWRWTRSACSRPTPFRRCSAKADAPSYSNGAARKV